MPAVMIAQIPAIAAALVIATQVEAIPFLRQAPGVVSVPVSRQAVAPKSQFYQFAGVDVSLENTVLRYVAKFDIGTPGQPANAAIDTGSADLWVYSPESGSTPSYNRNQSSTSRLIEAGGFSVNYVRGSSNGDIVTDTVSMGGANVTGQQFGVVSLTDGINPYGIFGIGRTRRTNYSTFPQSLKAQGFINQVAYSLALESLNSDQASIVFGGYDTSKFTPPLYTVPFTDPISLAVSVTAQNSSLSTTYTGILDSGTSYTYLPPDVWHMQMDKYNMTKADDETYYIDKLPGGPGISYNFSGAIINVPENELFIQMGNHAFSSTVIPNTQTGGTTLFGDSTLRSMYVIYHLDGNFAAIAQANYLNPYPNIQPIDGTNIPGAKPAPYAGFGSG